MGDEALYDALRERLRQHDEEWNHITPIHVEDRLMRLEQLMNLMVWAVGRLAERPVRYPEAGPGV